MSENEKHEELNLPKIVYDKNKKSEEAEERISDILSEAIYCYMIRKKLLKKFVE